MDNEFRQLVEAFKVKAELSTEELQHFQFSSLDDVLATLHSIQQKQSKTKRLTYMKRIDPFLKTVAEFGKVIEIFLNVSEVLAFVWGPLKCLLMVTSTFTDAFDSLLDTYQQIGEQIPLLESYKNLFSEHVHMRKVLILIFEDILSFHAMALRYFRQKLWKQLFKSNWKGFTSEITLLKDNLRRHKQLIETRASVIEFEAMQNLRVAAESHFRESREAETRRRKTAVFQWLSSPNVDAVHERHVKARSCNPRSCRWIFADDRFQKWFDPVFCSTSLLWIHGKPGAGKSVLASLIIEEVKKLGHFSVAFFYFGYGDPERDKFVPMARAILAQLLAQDSSLLLYLEEKMATSSGSATLSSTALAEELLQTALRRRRTCIILDGIDELSRDQRKETCQWFRAIVDSLPRVNQDEIRCLFVSQDDGIGRKDLSVLPQISLNPAKNVADITEFTRQRQAQIEEKFGKLEEHGLYLTEIVPARARGVFMFAKCVLEELHQQPSLEALLRGWRGEQFPSELNQVYDRILQRLLNDQVEERRSITKRLLSWISLSQRPLKWFEIQGAISIDLENESINEKHRRLVDTSKDLCASFVDVHADTTVELVHSTVRDFLRKRDIIKKTQVDLELCLLSISYLNFPDFCTNLGSEPIEKALLSGRYSFFEYAVACWAPHLMSCLSEERTNQEEFHELEETMELFLNQHLSRTGQDRITVSQAIHERLRPLKIFGCYNQLAQAVVWSRKQILLDKTESVKERLLDFPYIITHIRSIFESMIESGLTPEMRSALTMFYGDRWFKCPRIYCQHFYNGFQTKESRDRHLNRHDRAYTCTFDGCPAATFGLLTKSDLDKHMLESHGVSTNTKEFPTVPNPTVEHAIKSNSKYQCNLCFKWFTRAFNLKSHLRAHAGERPFACSKCEKSFTRENDRNSHEKLHAEEKEFVCGGHLDTGDSWGCKRRFGQARALARHLKSGIGRRCIKALDNEAAERLQESLNHNGEKIGSPMPLPEKDVGDTQQAAAQLNSMDPEAMDFELESGALPDPRLSWLSLNWG